MRRFNKIKNQLGILALFGLLFQIFMPIYQTYVYAEDVGITNAQALNEDSQLDKERQKTIHLDEKDEEATTEDSEEIQPDDEVSENHENIEEEANTDGESLAEPTDEKPAPENDETTNEITKPENLEEEAILSEEMQPDAAVIREPQAITDNIIDQMKLKYKDGSEFKEDDLISIDEDLRFELDWSIPNGHSYIAGDYFEFELPKEIKVYNPLNKDLGNYGSVTVDMDGRVKFIFNEKIEEESDIKGTFWFETELKESEITSTEETIELIINGKVVQKVIVNIKPTGGQAISKNGQPVNGSFNTEEVEWTVIANTTRESLKNAVIDDVILEGQELILDSLQLIEVEVDLAGQIVQELGEVTDFTNDSTPEKLNLKLGDTNKAYKLIFKTKLLEANFKEGTISYDNTAYLKSDGLKGAQAGGSVSVSRPKSMEKTSSAFDKEKRSVEWTVKANFTEQKLKKDDVITDEFTFKVGNETIDDVFEIKEANIEIVQVDEFDAAGNVVTTSNAKDLFDITVEKNKVTYKLKDNTNKAFILKYKTELKDEAYINKDGKITNKIDLNGKTSSSSQNIYQQVGKKINAGINYKDKTINWTITVNADKQDLRNVILTDDFAGTGQKLVEDSIKISPEATGVTVTPNADNEGFKINFGNITDTYTIQYQTKFTYDFNGTKTPNFKNGVNIHYETSDGSTYQLEFGNTVTPNTITKNNGAKNGEVNQKTKEITWKIDINYNGLALDDAKIRDVIPDNQSLIDDSLKIYETSINEKGSIKIGNEVSERFSVDQAENHVNIDFGSIKQSYRVEFKTKDKDGIYNQDEVYENTAQFIPRENEQHNLKAKVTLPNQGEFLGKTGTHNVKDWTIDWKIDVNKSLSTTSDFTVTDDLGDTAAQILLEDTIKVMKAGSTEELVEDQDYKLTVEGNKFKIYFPGEIKDAYVVTYSSYIVAEETIDIKNEAEIQSNDTIKGFTEKKETVTIKISSGGGTGEGTTGGLVLEKFEAESDRALKDVEFSLVKKIGSQEIVVRTGQTDDNGKLAWTGLQYGNYKLREVVPAGYLGEAEREVSISSKDPNGIKTLSIENEREKGTIRIIKVDSVDENKILPGATFTLQNQTTGIEYTFETNEEGIILKTLPFGEYTVKEILAPTGYRITKDIPNVQVEIGKTATIEVENVAFVDVEGQKNWIADKDKELPESITVKLFADGKEIKDQTITKDEDWKYSFKNLDKYNQADREINYEIQEEPVDGFVLEKEGYHLTNIQTINLSGQKTWKDTEDTANRPSSITVQLLANGKEVSDQALTVTASNNWAYTFEAVPKYDTKGELIHYTVDEVAVDGYDKKINDLNIENTRANIIKITGNKIWKDDDNKENTRPDEITVNLTREVMGDQDKEFFESQVVTPNSKGDWIYEFIELPEFDENGAAYTYTVQEDTIPDGYESKIDENNNIENVRVGKTEFSGTKRWKDDKVTDRPDFITVNLLRNNVVIESKEVTADDKWTYSFTNLDEYDEEGRAYHYAVTEEQVPGYKPQVSGRDITNTRSEKTAIEITKGWLDDHSENRPDAIPVYVYQNNKLFDTVFVKASEDWIYELANLEAYDEDGQPYIYTIEEGKIDSKDKYQTTINGFNITNLRIGKTEVSGEKYWDEVDNQYRPEEISVNLFANDKEIDSTVVSKDTNWKYAFKNLDQYDENGKEIAYRIEEVEVPGYESAVDGYDITNKQITTEVTGEKIWLDDNRPDRPDSITIELFANDKATGKSIKVKSETDAHFTFTDLAKYDQAGEEINYTIKEKNVPTGYEEKIEGLKITNLRVGTIEVMGEKIWKDAGPEDRPESIEVTLTREVNGKKDEEFSQTAKVTPDYRGKWLYGFGELEEFDEEGIAYDYHVKEDGVPTGYESSVDGYDITNLRVGTIDLNISKKWEKDTQEKRPGSIEVDLLRKGKVLQTVTLSEATGWVYEFTDLPAFDKEGKEYTYTVKEKPVAGYKMSLKETETGFEIINTYDDSDRPGKPVEPSKPGKPSQPGGSTGSDQPTGPELPKTGEVSSVALYLIGGLLVIVGLIIGKKREEE